MKLTKHKGRLSMDIFSKTKDSRFKKFEIRIGTFGRETSFRWVPRKTPALSVGR